MQTELISDGNSSETCPEEHNDSIGFNSCSFSWEGFDDERSGKAPERKVKNKSRKRFTLRIDEPLHFKRGGVNIIIGPTASGKVSYSGYIAIMNESQVSFFKPDFRSYGAAWRNVL